MVAEAQRLHIAAGPGVDGVTLQSIGASYAGLEAEALQNISKGVIGYLPFPVWVSLFVKDLPDLDALLKTWSNSAIAVLDRVRSSVPGALVLVDLASEKEDLSAGLEGVAEHVDAIRIDPSKVPWSATLYLASQAKLLEDSVASALSEEIVARSAVISRGRSGDELANKCLEERLTGGQPIASFKEQEGNELKSAFFDQVVQHHAAISAAALMRALDVSDLGSALETVFGREQGGAIRNKMATSNIGAAINVDPVLRKYNDLKKEHEELKGSLDAMQLSLTRVNAEVVDYRTRYQSVVTSRSWQFLAPYRNFMALFR